MDASSKAFAAIAVCVFLVISFLVLYGPSVGLSSGTDMPFEMVDPGNGYGYESRANFTIENGTFWESLWLELYSGYEPIPEVPAVNFTSETLIAVFQGVRSSGGHWTNITRIIMTDTNYVVYVDEMHPGNGCGVTAVLTYPYQIVKINEHPLSLPVQFIYNIIVYECE
ncbi:MAG: protease complex subunit PrcB family protein [Candidatus Thorarchaeota archaeon]|nr:protease complex subunit PrcB family protein [Candidatus Thorarchaeota archaeon]